MKQFLAFDVGTTAMKCILFDNNLKEVFAVNREYSIDAKENGIAELDASIYFESFCECIREMLRLGADKEQIAAITFTTQGETLIPVDKDGNPVCPALVWLDTRAKREAEVIRENILSQRFYETTGLCNIDGALPAAKLLWIYRNKRTLYDKIHKLLLLEDYLIYKITGRFISEKSLQSSTGWYDIINDKLFDDVLKLCKIEKSKLPEILPCGTVVGQISSEAASLCGLSEKTFVVTGAMDQIASAVGVGNITEGMCTETTGTALVVGVTVKNPIFDIKNPVTVYKHFDNQFIYMPYCSTAGMTLKWFRDNVMPYAVDKAREKGISSYGIIDETAAKSPVGSNGVIMLPQLSECGAFIGLTLAAETSDMARSVLEGVGYMLKQILERVEQSGVTIDEVCSLGGGSYSSLWCQIKADICGKNILRTEYAQTTALGAAILAAVALGEYKSVADALKACERSSEVITPDKNNSEIYKSEYLKYTKYLNSVKGLE